MVDVTSLSVSSPDFQTLLHRHRAFWQRAPADSLLRSAGVFAASVPVCLPQPEGPGLTHAERLKPQMIYPALMIDQALAWDPGPCDPAEVADQQKLAFLGLGDLMPHSQPFFKIPWLEAMLGCPIKMTEGQIWVKRYEGDLETLIRRGIHLEHNPWFSLYLQFLEQLQRRLGRHYPASANTLLRGPSDLVAALLGVREACVGWIEQPDLMARLMRLCTDANLALIQAGSRAVQPFAGGYMSGFAIWAPSPVVRTQADHSSLLSPQMYERQILPFDLEVIRACPSCIFHIHNNGLHVAPFLAQIPELDVIQVVVDPYPAGARKQYEIEMLQLIQAHKPLLLDVNFPNLEEADWFLAQLSPRGLCLNARFAPDVFRAAPAELPGRTYWRLE